MGQLLIIALAYHRSSGVPFGYCGTPPLNGGTVICLNNYNELLSSSNGQGGTLHFVWVKVGWCFVGIALYSSVKHGARVVTGSLRSGNSGA